ncbi:MAG: hypothetical protein P8J87_20250, partial [Verrucomicrobiales bacterium]|nr:hypothetical protein [Verrucomicrobiales bacterium]
ALALAAPILSLAAPPEVDLQPLPEGGYQPDLAVASNTTVHLIYHTGDAAAADILHTIYSPHTRSFSPPTRVNSLPAWSRPAVAQTKSGITLVY